MLMKQLSWVLNLQVKGRIRKAQKNEGACRHVSPGNYFTAQELCDDYSGGPGISFKCLQDKLKSLSVCPPSFLLLFLISEMLAGVYLDWGLTAISGQCFLLAFQ